MQIVSPTFTALAQGDVRPISYGISVSFDKAYDDNTTFFILNQSALNGVDLLAPTGDNPIQAWDYYKYKDYTERVVYQTVSRELEFPFSVVSAIADFQLNNYDRYFTPNSASPISAYILPKRPLRLFHGFGNFLLPQFVGLTQGMPTVSRVDGTATFTAMDFLTWIYDMPIRDTILMVNVRTDEVLAEIFTQFGLSPSQYDLARARNTIPFLFFEEKQQTAGDVIRPLMEAEMGMLWLDEEGIIRFRPRLEQTISSSYSLNSDSIISLDTDGEDSIINHVIISTEVRELQEAQIVYSVTGSSADSSNTIPASTSSRPFKLLLDDPTINIVLPTYGENSSLSWITATTLDGELVASGVSVASVAQQTNSYTLFVTNSNAFPVVISSVTLWGEPAKVIGGKPTIYDSKDTDSIAKYEEQPIKIENNFIQSVDQAQSLALTMLDEYSEYADIITMEIKGNPALQLSDVVSVNYHEYSGQYRIIKITNTLSDRKYTQILRCKMYLPRNWFVLNHSLLNGTDVLAP